MLGVIYSLVLTGFRLAASLPSRCNRVYKGHCRRAKVHGGRLESMPYGAVAAFHRSSLTLKPQ
jgi:hypothetical protein